MNRKNFSANILTVVLILTAYSEDGLTQCVFEPQPNADSYLGSLDALVAQGCFGGDSDGTEIAQAIKKGLNQIDNTPRDGEQLTLLTNQLGDLLNQIDGSLKASFSEVSGNWQKYIAITMDELDAARQQISNYQSTIPAVYWDRGRNYDFFEGDVTNQYLIEYGNDIRRACPDSTFPDSCKSALWSASVLTRNIALVNRVLANPVRQKLSERHAEINALDDQWDYYFDKARSQYWWEFLANNTLYDPPGDQLAAPPDAQLILFHPRAAVEYENGSFDSQDSYNLVGIIEVIGYNRLRWKKGAPYSNWPLGVSLVASYVPASDGDDFGYGVMVHVKNRYSFGATRRDTGMGDDTTWIFSVDLNKLFLEKSKAARESFRFGD